jgi:hypothetical protein
MLPFFYHSYSKPCSAEFHKFSLHVISSSNLTLYPKKLQLVDAVTKVITFTKPFAVCCSCGKILYTSQVYWLKNVDENLWRARSFISPSSSLKIEKKWFEVLILYQVVMSVLQNCQKVKTFICLMILVRFLTVSSL